MGQELTLAQGLHPTEYPGIMYPVQGKKFEARL